MGKINKTVSIDPAPTGGKCDPRKSQSHIPKPSIEPSTEMKRRSFDKLVKSYKNWAKLVKLISLEVYGCTVNCETVEKIYVDKFTKLASNNGKKYAITYLKQVRSHIYQFIASDVQTLGSNVKVTHDGIPVFLGDIIPVVRKRCKSTLRVLLSFSNIGRLYKNVGKVDTSNIVHESALDTQKSISRNTISNYIRHYSLFNSNTRNVVDNPVFYIRSSNGPFGPAMTSVMEEAKYLTPIMIECIQKLDHKIMDGSSKYKIADLIREIRHGNIDIPSEGKKEWQEHRNMYVVTSVTDKEMKDRTIAILPYWVQIVMKPYHNDIMSKLRNNFKGRDATYDQTGAVARIRDLAFTKSNKNKLKHSLDLKAATDLMPMQLHERLFAALYGQVEAEAGTELLIGQPYYVKDKNIYVKYKTGQPMGAYSSGPMLAMTHHLIVYAAAERCQKIGPHKNQGINFYLDHYALLGDDIVIVNDLLAEQYGKLVEELGMKIQRTKTILSKDSFEFCKRFFFKGEEYSPLPLGELAYAKYAYGTVSSFMHKMHELQFPVSLSRLGATLSNFLFIGRKKKYMYDKIMQYTYSINFYKEGGRETFTSKLNKWLKNIESPFSCNTTEEFKMQFLLELYIALQSMFVHENIVKATKSVNVGFRHDYFVNYKDAHSTDDTIKYHPLVSMVNEAFKCINQIEYSNSADASAEMQNYEAMKLSLKNFIMVPTDITSVFSKSGHASTMKVRARLNDGVLNHLKDDAANRKILLSNLSDDEVIQLLNNSPS